MDYLLHIQTLFIKHFTSSMSTDYRYFWKLKSLEQTYPLKFYMCDSIPVMITANMTSLVNSLLYRTGFARGIMLTKGWQKLSRSIVLPLGNLIKKEAAIIFTNQYFPINKMDRPIVFESDFFPYGLGREQEIIKKILYVPECFIEKASVVCVRHDLSLKAYKSQFPRYSDKAVLVPFYLPDLEAISEEQILKKFESFGRPKIKILFVGNLARLKGLPQLIQAFEIVKHSYPKKDLELTIVSRFRDGKVRIPPYVKRFSNLGQKEVHGLMAESHIFAMPSRRDAIGIVFWEAMANGCVLLVPDVSPQREMFGEFGLTAYPLSVKNLSRALEKMIKDSDFLLSCALRARETFLGKYHHSIVGPKYYDVFRKLIS